MLSAEGLQAEGLGFTGLGGIEFGIYGVYG